ncbi:histidine phosphatase family protein [Luteibacter aegosomaticola]|uniref:histidine phosphatase family protein n=1 Tax=Luteibacter aegosomaticola TaxID=2911538 RepID=UPI001FFA946A|nr:histidine phosphatase family protein [Luteibacter aegosomaticola]UPG90036.1 histidine phosphatase family protein [Luteibacter aegosomaticola]
MLEHLIVCRHGETVWNIERRAQGRGDSPLTEAGIGQAQALGRALAARGIEHIVSSTLGRALHTAEIVSEITGCAVSVDERLVERAFGELEGKRFEAMALDPVWTAVVRCTDPDATAPGAESLREVATRVLAALHDIRKLPYRSVAVITHGQSISSMLATLRDDHSDYAVYRHGNCGYTPLHVREGGFGIDAWNLDPLAVELAERAVVTDQK